MSNRKAPFRSSWRSSAGVSRSKSSVPKPAACRAAATSLLRELWRELPLPWANTTIARAGEGTTRSPSIDPLSTERRIATPRDKIADLLIGHRREVLVVHPDRVEVAELTEADELVDLAAQVVGRLRGADRHRDDQPGGLLAADRARRRSGRRA